MTNKEFISTICEYYKISRRLVVDPRPHTIWRGVNHSVSSKAEDLFALFVAEHLKDSSLEFIVDKTMTYKLEGQNSIQFRPDLAIVKNGTLTHSIDLKMDMGYKRRYFETVEFEKQERKFRAFRNQHFEKVSYKQGGDEVKLDVSKKIINQIVVISEKNGGKSANRVDMISAIKDLDWVEIYYLSGATHPNNYENKMPRINDEAFEKLITDIKTLA